MSIKTDNQIKLSDGHTVGYAEYGDPKGKPVMHFHGTPSSRFEADNPDLDAIAERLNVRYIVPDRPGIGLSDWKPYTIASYPDIVAEFAWTDKKMELVVSWPHGAPTPPSKGEFR